MCKRSINWLTLTCPRLRTWPATKACALTRNRTGDLLVCGMMLNPLSPTSQSQCIVFWNKFQRQKYKWQEYGYSTRVPRILNKQDLELGFQRCLQWLRTRTSFWSSPLWPAWDSSIFSNWWKELALFRHPLTHERAENLAQSGKLSNFRCVHAFKIKHQKQQKYSYKTIAQKMRLIRPIFLWRKLHSVISLFLFFFGFFSAPFLALSLYILFIQ